MLIPEQVLKKFESLLREDYPEREFSEAEVVEIATRIIRLTELIYKPIPEQLLTEFTAINQLHNNESEQEELQDN